MPKCSFCKKPLKKGKGLMYVKSNGKILYFDSKKCEKNMIKLGRDPRNLKWASPEKEK